MYSKSVMNKGIFSKSTAHNVNKMGTKSTPMGPKNNSFNLGAVVQASQSASQLERKY